MNTFAPGFMDTPAVMNRPDMKSGRLEQLAARHADGPHPAAGGRSPARRCSSATDDAIHITGSYMICDGGYSMLGA